MKSDRLNMPVSLSEFLSAPWRLRPEWVPGEQELAQLQEAGFVWCERCSAVIGFFGVAGFLLAIIHETLTARVFLALALVLIAAMSVLIRTSTLLAEDPCDTGERFTASAQIKAYHRQITRKVGRGPVRAEVRHMGVMQSLEDVHAQVARVERELS